MPTIARQLPSFEFGKPEKLHPHPKSQLQNSYPCPSRAQLVTVSVAMYTHLLFVGRDEYFEDQANLQGLSWPEARECERVCASDLV
jgi:hypothetical protein